MFPEGPTPLVYLGIRALPGHSRMPSTQTHAPAPTRAVASHYPHKQTPSNHSRSPGVLTVTGGELGIRTPDRIESYTRLAGEHLRPLGQLSGP